MHQPKAHITIHMVSSLDGFVADKQNQMSWFETESPYEKGAEMPEAEAFLKQIDAYIMGAKTYRLAQALSAAYGWPYGDKPVYVLTHQSLEKVNEHIHFCSGNLHDFLNQHIHPNHQNVWVAGGPELCHAFLEQNLVNHLRISILPIMLGNGLPFFKTSHQITKWILKESIAYKNGMVELQYELNK